jgi:site-specific DNA-cytosine methylase
MNITIKFDTDDLEEIEAIKTMLLTLGKMKSTLKNTACADGINVLSLFNGMSCGMMALELAGVKVNNFYSSEIDKYANEATKTIYPEIIQLGDMTKWEDWGDDFNLSNIDLLLAGFPCQAWSMAGVQGGDSDPRGALVHDLIRLWKAINKSREKVGKGKVKFMFENVKMKKEFLDYINDLFEVTPICINSALVSAQNRSRYYWTNIGKVEQPENKHIYIKDIWDGGIDITERFNKKKEGTLAFSKSRSAVRELDDKSKCLTTHGQGIANSGATNIKIGDKYYIPSVKECMRLQTVPEEKINTLLNTDISKTQLSKMTGNGWTVDVIAHIFRGINENN